MNFTTAHQSRMGVAIIAVAALVLGIGYAVHLGDQLRYPDERDYVAIARTLSDHGIFSRDGQTPTAYRPPGYPFLLATLAKAGAGVVGFRLLNMVAFAGCIVFCAGLAMRASGQPRAGIVAALLAAAYPLNFYTAGTLYPQTISACGLLAALTLMTHKSAPSIARYFGGGLLLGALTLVSPTSVCILAVFLLWSLLYHRRRALLPLGMLLLAWALVLAPWIARNQQQFGRFVFVSTNGGINLLLGNSEHTTPNAGVNVDLSRYYLEAGHLDEIDRSRYYTSAALDHIRQHPRASVILYARKFLNHFHYRNTLNTAGEARPWRDLLLLCTYGPLLMLTLLRLAGTRRRTLHPTEVLLIALYLGAAAFLAIFFTRIRFRMPFDFALVVLAANAIALWALPVRAPAESQALKQNLA
ncbi:MAG: hypothetical protein O3A51_09860 [Verrucomicrobia bacterium]|nr:hypothetical protein [Verrucomicrobiota bacterium]